MLEPELLRAWTIVGTLQRNLKDTVLRKARAIVHEEGMYFTGHDAANQTV
jgi:hypothetical protein